MSSFEKGWPVWRDHEGKRFTDYSWDPGAATKFGITLRTAQAAQGIDFDVDRDGHIDAHDIQIMEEPKAKEFYQLWWDRYGYSLIVDQQVATKVMDMSINMGPRGISKDGSVYGAHAMVQRAVNLCGYSLIVDGKLGAMSYKEINACDSRELLLELCCLQSIHYSKWCDEDPKREVARFGLHDRASWPFVPNGYVKELTA